MICSEFAAGRMSYAKVRALTRIATPQTEAGLAEITGPMTAAQCERFVAAHRAASDAGDVAARAARRVSVTVGEDGSVAVSARLPAVEGAVVVQALRAAAGDCEHPHRPHPTAPRTLAPPRTPSPAADSRAPGWRGCFRDGPGPGPAAAPGGPGAVDLPGEPGRCAGGGGRGVPVGEDCHRGQPRPLPGDRARRSRSPHRRSGRAAAAASPAGVSAETPGGKPAGTADGAPARTATASDTPLYPVASPADVSAETPGGKPAGTADGAPARTATASDTPLYP